MAERHETETYAASFRAFLDHTEEKRDLADFIVRIIKWGKVKTLLDLGAGDGNLARRIAPHVSEYVAVEQNQSHVARLAEYSSRVHQGEFPGMDVEGTFDLVLSSHSTPWKSEAYEPFIRAAIARVKPSGSFLIVTYDDEEGEWIDFRRATGLPFANSQRGRLTTLRAFLLQFGMVAEEIVTTYVVTETLDEMRQALAFVYSDGVPEKLEEFFANEQVSKVLESKYRDKRGFSFPFNHLMLHLLL